MWNAKAKGAYARDSDEAIQNANEVYSILFNKGWTLNAVCGLLGNVGSESGYNPWRWQSDKMGTSSGSPWKNKGYGLTQFTPAGKYISSSDAKKISGYAPNFSDKKGNASDGYAQCVFLDAYADYYKTNAYPLTYSEFKESEETPSYLAKAWLYNYERPADPSATEETRSENAEYWYKVLSGEEPPTPPEPPEPFYSKKKTPIWVFIKRRRF